MLVLHFLKLLASIWWMINVERNYRPTVLWNFSAKHMRLKLVFLSAWQKKHICNKCLKSSSSRMGMTLIRFCTVSRNSLVFAYSCFPKMLALTSMSNVHWLGVKCKRNDLGPPWEHWDYKSGIEKGRTMKTFFESAATFCRNCRHWGLKGGIEKDGTVKTFFVFA